MSQKPHPTRDVGPAEDAALSCPLPLCRSSLRTSGSSSSTCSSSSWKLSSGEAGAAAWGSRSTTAGRGRRSWSKRSSSSSRCGQLGREGSASAAWCAQGDDSSSTERGVPGSSLAGCSPLRSCESSILLLLAPLWDRRGGILPLKDTLCLQEPPYAVSSGCARDIPCFQRFSRLS